MKGADNINEYGILNSSDLKKMNLNKIEYNFPSETGIYIISGKTVARYWGNDNLILLVETYDGRKLKFAFWKNKKYCIEPIDKKYINNTKDSIKYLKDGTKVKIVYQKSEKAKITRVRNLKILE